MFLNLDRGIERSLVDPSARMYDNMASFLQ